MRKAKAPQDPPPASTMASAAFSAAITAMWAAITAIQLYYSLNLQPGAGTSTTTTTSATAAPASVSIADFQQIFLTLVPAGGLYAAVVLLYRRLHLAEAGDAADAGAGGGDWRPSNLVAFISAAVGVLKFFLFVDDVGAVGLAAARVLPTASIATFFVGMQLIILVHLRAGGERGGGGAVAGDGAIRAPVWLMLVAKMAFAAVARLVVLMAIALCAKY